MELPKKFQQTDSSRYVPILSEVDKKYPIDQAERAETRYGPSVLLSLRDSSGSLKVFLPKRYTEAVSETDIHDINSQKVTMSHVKRAICSNQVLYLDY